MRERQQRGGGPSEAIYRVIGQRIHEAMLQEQLNQQQLASDVAVVPSALNQWLSGRRRIPIEQLRRIAERLRKPMAFFLGEAPLTFDTQLGYEMQGLDDDDRVRLLAIARALRGVRDGSAA